MISICERQGTIPNNLRFCCILPIPVPQFKTMRSNSASIDLVLLQEKTYTKVTLLFILHR